MAVVLVGLVALLFWRPAVGFIALFLLRPAVELSRAFPDQTIFGASVVQTAGVGIPILLLLVMFVRRGLTARVPLIILAVATALTVPLARGADTTSVEIWLRLVTPLPILLFPLLIHWDEREMLWFSRAVGASVVLVFATLVAGWANPASVSGGVQVGEDLVIRLSGVFGVAVLTGYWVAIFIGFCVFLGLTETRRSLRWVYFVAAALLLFPLYATLSRTAWVSIVAAFMAYMMLRGNVRGLLFVAALSATALFAVPSVRLRIFAENFGGTGRGRVWWPAWDAYVDSSIYEKLAGFGWNAIEGRVRQYVDAEYSMVGTGTTENSLIYLTLGGGLITLACTIALWTWAVQRALVLRAHGTPGQQRFASFAVAMFAMMFLQGMTGDQIMSPVLVWYFYALLGIAAAGVRENVEALSIAPPLLSAKALP